MKRLSLFLVLALLIGMVGIAPMAAAEGEPLTISITTTEFGISPIDSPVQKAWEEAMSNYIGRPITFDYEFINIGDYATKCKLILSTASLPDILTVGWVDHSEVMRLGDSGMFVELTEHWDALPHYKEVFDGDGTAAKRALTPEGKLYAFYNAQYYPDGNPALNYGSAVRTDILTELNLEVPTNLDEFYQVAKAIKEAKPDVYPVFQHEDWEKPQDSVFGAYGVTSGRFWDGEKYAYGPVTDEYREALRYMNKLYTEGLISPDYFTHTSETGIATVANGSGYMALNLWNGYCNTLNWGKDYPEQGWTLVPFLPAGDKIAEGDRMFDKGVEYDWRINTGYSRVISANAKEIDALLMLLDYEYSPEMNDLFTYGIEGLTFEYDADGNKKFTDAYINNELKESGLGDGSCRAGIFPELQNRSLAVTSQRDMPLPIYDIFTGEVINVTEQQYANDNVNPAYTAPVDPAVVLSSDDQTEYANIHNLVKTVVDEWFVRFVQGDASIDNDWDAYLGEIAGMGDIDEMLNYYNQYITQ